MNCCDISAAMPSLCDGGSEMKIETAVKRLQEEYERAKNLEFVRDPVAYALYQVWKEADKRC